jgi:hypothetical protein
LSPPGQGHGKSKSGETVTAGGGDLNDPDDGGIRAGNDALLALLAEAKKTCTRMTKAEMLQSPRVSALVNKLISNNEAWIATCIARNIRRHRHLHAATVQELYSTALVGKSAEDGTVSGAMNAILTYDYQRFGTAAFTHYLHQAIHNALQPTATQKKTHKGIYARMRPEPLAEAELGCRDRRQKSPPADAIDRDLLAVVQSVIPRLPTPQQRDTAAWMMKHILSTGELPIAREAAQRQRPRVSRERGRQIMEATVNSIRRQIEADYPQLAEDGLNGWETFKKAFDRLSPSAGHAR